MIEQENKIKALLMSDNPANNIIGAQLATNQLGWSKYYLACFIIERCSVVKASGTYIARKISNFNGELQISNRFFVFRVNTHVLLLREIKEVL